MQDHSWTTLVAGDSGARTVAGPQLSTRWGNNRITQGQLEAVAMRCREELGRSLGRTGTAAIAEFNDSVLTIRVEHSLTAAEHQLMRRATGRAFFQYYVEELAEQMFPDFRHHVEQILPCAVTFMRVKVHCEEDCIIFTFGLHSNSQRFL